MKSHLQVKVFSLAEEISYIHRKEIYRKRRARFARRKNKNPDYQMDNFWTLRAHRAKLKVDFRNTHIAHCFLRGRAYSEIEVLSYTAPDWGKIEDMIVRFSKDEPGDSRDLMQRFSEWKTAALEYSEASIAEASKRLNIPRAKKIRPSNGAPERTAA
jgi:hypothetical protein